MVNLCLKYFSFCIYFILYLHVWIRTYRAPEFESHTGPDPHPQCCRWLGNFANEKIKQAKNILFPWTATASPATIDFCVNLDRDFQSIVVDKLSRLSRDALTEQPVGMTDSAKKKIQKEIMYSVYGKLIFADFLLVLLLPLLWSCSILTRLQLAMLTSAPASHDDFGSISNSCSVFQNLFFKKNVGHSTFYSTSL